MIDTIIKSSEFTEQFESAWRKALTARNVTGTRIAAYFAIFMYLGFGILDLVVVPTELIFYFFAIRVFVFLIGVSILVLHKYHLLETFATPLSAILIVSAGVGIDCMCMLLGGFSSTYYSGVNLVMLATGLLFLWPRWLLLLVYGSIVGLYLILNSTSFPDHIQAGLASSFFVVSTALISGVGQNNLYRIQKEEVRSRCALEKARSELEKLYAELQRLDEFKTRFFANITHELKTPLGAILAPLELMIEGSMGEIREAQKVTLKTMYHNGLKLLKLIGDLLDLTKMQESKLRLKVGHYDLVAHLRDLISLIQPMTQRKKIEVLFSPEKEEIYAWCDIERMERVFINLLSNAVKFTQEGGHVWVSVSDSERFAVITVRDDGPGFPASQAERIFERFYQADMGTTRRYGGTGIGLALAREIVNLHGGTISAESDVGKGALFRVMIPKDKEHFPPEVLERRHTEKEWFPERRKPEKTVTEWALQLTQKNEYRLLDILEATERRAVDRDPEEILKTKTVLVVDDTPDILRIVHLALHRYFRVMTAEDGKKGLELAIREMPDLIITDLMMPEMDGLELTRRLRENPKTRHIPILMLSAKADVEDRLAGIEGGVNGYIAKPFSTRELVAIVTSLLNVQEQTAEILLSQKMDSIEIIAASLAHEINNPLNYLTNSLAMIRRDTMEILEIVQSSQGRDITLEEKTRIDKLKNRCEKFFETAEAGIKRIASTVETMRRYGREGYARKPRSYDTFSGAKDVIRIVASAVGRDCELITEFDGNGEIECIPEEFNQMLSNLVQNAIEAVPSPGGKVRIRGKGKDDCVVFEVADNGPGIPPEKRSRVFSAYYTTKGGGKGMGIGLTIVWRVVKSLGGSIVIDDSDMGGANFVVTLPRKAK